MFLFKPYKELDHTADLRLEIRALTWKQLLQNAAIAFTDQLTNRDAVSEQSQQAVTIQAPSRDELLVACLKKMLLLFEINGFVTHRLQVQACSSTTLRAVAHGERFDPQRHPPKTEIKAVTYHQLEVKRVWWGWRARVIFDI